MLCTASDNKNIMDTSRRQLRSVLISHLRYDNESLGLFLSERVNLCGDCVFIVKCLSSRELLMKLEKLKHVCSFLAAAAV